MHSAAASRIALAATLCTLAAPATVLAGPATTNSDGDVLIFSARVTPPVAGTVKAPQGVGIGFDAFIGNRLSAGNAIPTNAITFTLPPGFKENGLQFPACQITLNQVSACPRASQVGSGTAETQLLNPGGEPPTYTQASVALYNGKPLTPGSSPTLIFITRVAGRPTGELDFTLRPTPQGLKVDQTLVPQAGTGTGLTRLSLTIPARTVSVAAGRRTNTIPFLTAPTTCTGSWTFGLTTTSAGRKPLVATDREPCVAAPAPAPARKPGHRSHHGQLAVSRLRSAAVSGL